jgi:glucose uptake protein
MLSKNLFFVLLILAVAMEIGADIFFKKWAMQNRMLLLAVGLALYLIGTAFWAYSLKYEQLSKAVIIFTVLNLIGVLLAGLLIFNEKLNLWNKLGVALGVASVILLQI